MTFSKETGLINRIKQVYFSDPTKRIFLKKGEILVDQGKSNRRLCLVISGALVAKRRSDDGLDDACNNEWFEMFRSTTGDFVCVQSFFSGAFISFSRIMATEDSEIAYIDSETKAVEPEKYGSLLEQLVPTMVFEIAMRNINVLEKAKDREIALKRLHRSEMNATLGQLAAGLSHELNNAVGVMERKTDYISDFLDKTLENKMPTECTMFRKGLNYNDIISSETLRTKTREYEEKFDLSSSAAKVLAKTAPTDKDVKELGKSNLSNMEYLSTFWELGHDIHDIRMAAEHAANIVKSVRVLGGGKFKREEGINLHETLAWSISLLKVNLKNVRLQVNIPKALRKISLYGDITELVQIWVNIIKNSCDAMDNAGITDPTITISYKADDENVTVTIEDNGPGIPEKIKDKIFQPDFTTKKNGLSFGLGLGLTIVQRLVESYSGDIILDSKPGKTAFNIKLPLHNKELQSE